MKDEKGNDLGAVYIPVDGNVAFAPLDKFTGPPTNVQGAAPDYKLPEGVFTKLGLLTEDGGPEWGNESGDDSIKFWQDGYEIASGTSEVTLTITLAETAPSTALFLHGKSHDEHGYMTVDLSADPGPFALFVEEIAKNGVIRRRLAERATIKEKKETKSERGAVTAYEVTISLGRVNSAHYHEWIVDPNKPISEPSGPPGP